MFNILSAALMLLAASVSTRRAGARVGKPRQQDGGADAYRPLQDSAAELGSWMVLPWTLAAVDVFNSLKPLQTNIGTMDLRVASISLR